MDEEIAEEQKFSVEKELDAIIDFLKDSKQEIQKLLQRCENMKQSLEKGTKEQLFAWDDLVKNYEFLEEDVDVNGERVKKITDALIEQARQVNIDKDKLEEFKKKESWSFDW